MKANRLAINLMVYMHGKSMKKNRAEIFKNLSFRHQFDVNYAGDALDRHCFDIYYPEDESRNNKLIIDIHGGAYILSHRKDNLAFATPFLKKGYDFIAMDYRPNNGRLSIYDQLCDLAQGIRYILKHAEELGVSEDEVYLTGDSAGGHMSLVLAALSTDSALQESVGLNLSQFKPRAVLVNCSVFDFAGAGMRNGLTKGAQKRMYGPRYLDFDFLNQYSPASYVNQLTLPVFASTCTLDFIRHESLGLQRALQGKNDFEFLDIESENKLIDHVHNVVRPDLPESIRVNEAMMAFMEKY